MSEDRIVGGRGVIGAWVSNSEEEAAIASMPPAERGLYDAIVERVCKSALQAEVRAKVEWANANEARLNAERRALELASIPAELESLKQQLDEIRGHLLLVHEYALRAALPWWKRLFG